MSLSILILNSEYQECTKYVNVDLKTHITNCCDPKKAKNLYQANGKPSKTGHTVLELQKSLKHARVVYASATGASEPKHMSYMSRIGLWGAGTGFRNSDQFVDALTKAGVGAMELVAMDMKRRGVYLARQLSFAGKSNLTNQSRNLSPSI